ncbi:(deoxy)nucleoside triphosphate pyrophosphohydrolase [Paenibacillus sp. 1011MAR3C5]|uniref:(deoxy)nucleoside triphosphate pyrophosphohydrolase n=1 Tax=Paenibacillus sp. 1011MAR3C5 TaxID=1675787 RepID=UPI000E6B8398|nr:(deoxy)nucleoside triphosphate pyrophosphohydrolase [Paenibacillus sp. 1011MAR3C5]RJE87626.1 (deoxy)nucleoside triphosphate pyrophosphohydrolase [Paenibacillus sp. 1011MAR3C5]
MTEYIYVAGAVIRNHDGDVLCALRSVTMSMPGLWEFPGGKLEPNESAEECLVREIEEELGCAIQVGRQIADVIYEYPSIRVRLVTYESKLASGTPVAREHERLLWLPVSRLTELEWAPADWPTVDALRRSESHES